MAEAGVHDSGPSRPGTPSGGSAGAALHPVPSPWSFGKPLQPTLRSGSSLSRRGSAVTAAVAWLPDEERHELDDCFEALCGDAQHGHITAKHVAKALAYVLGVEAATDKAAKAAFDSMCPNISGQLDKQAFRTFMLSHWSPAAKTSDGGSVTRPSEGMQAAARLVDVIRTYRRKTLAERTFKKAHEQMRRLQAQDSAGPRPGSASEYVPGSSGGSRDAPRAPASSRHSFDSVSLPCLSRADSRRSSPVLPHPPTSGRRSSQEWLHDGQPPAALQQSRSSRRGSFGDRPAISVDVPRSSSCSVTSGPTPLSRFRRTSLLLIEAALAAEKQTAAASAPASPVGSAQPTPFSPACTDAAKRHSAGGADLGASRQGSLRTMGARREGDDGSGGGSGGGSRLGQTQGGWESAVTPPLSIAEPSTQDFAWESAPGLEADVPGSRGSAFEQGAPLQSAGGCLETDALLSSLQTPESRSASQWHSLLASEELDACAATAKPSPVPPGALHAAAAPLAQMEVHSPGTTLGPDQASSLPQPQPSGQAAGASDPSEAATPAVEVSAVLSSSLYTPSGASGDARVSAQASPGAADGGMAGAEPVEPPTPSPSKSGSVPQALLQQGAHPSVRSVTFSVDVAPSAEEAFGGPALAAATAAPDATSSGRSSAEQVAAGAELEASAAGAEDKKMSMSWISRRLTRFLFKEASDVTFSSASSDTGSTGLTPQPPARPWTSHSSPMQPGQCTPMWQGVPMQGPPGMQVPMHAGGPWAMQHGPHGMMMPVPPPGYGGPAAPGMGQGAGYNGFIPSHLPAQGALNANKAMVIGLTKSDKGVKDLHWHTMHKLDKYKDRWK